MELERGLLFCGTCGTTAEAPGSRESRREALPPLAANQDAPPPQGQPRDRASLVSELAVDDALDALIARQRAARETVWVSPSRAQVRAMLEGGAPRIAGAEQERLRTHEHEWTRCPECRQPGRPCPCSGTVCCEMQRREIAAANEAASEERERAERDAAKLAEIAALCREPYETCGATGADLVRASDILAITGTGEETRDG